MLDLKFVRNNPETVKENIKKKFQDEKLPLVDEVLELDQKNRDIKQEVEALRAERNKISKQIGACMAQGKKEEAEELKKKVQANADRVESLSSEEKEVEERIQNGTEDPNRFLTLTEIEELWGKLIGDTNVLYSDMLQSLIQNIDERELVRQKKENSRPEE